ncbi:MAG: B12-binding domain-containing radical SAM protein, partial [Thermoplasmata archaeon]
GYWQLATDEKLDRFGIDYLVEGEAEISAPKLFHSLLEDHPGQKRMVRDRFPEADEIPPILGPTNCSLVEITRGCGRGCKFCAPTTAGKLRSLPLEKIVHDVKIHADMGYKKVTFQSDDCLRYGSRSLEADKDMLMNLYDECFSTGIKELFITHASLVTFADQPEVIEALTKKLRSHGIKYYGCQPGLETGSYRLIDRYMKGKASPRDPEEWGSTVIEAMKVMKKHKWYPVCTLISGLPEEEVEDIRMTIDLIKKLEGFPALYIPLFFVPMAMTSLRDREAFIAEKMTTAHWDLMLTCWDHNLKYIYSMYLLVSKEYHNPFLRFTMKTLTNILKMGMNLKREELLRGD